MSDSARIVSIECGRRTHDNQPSPTQPNGSAANRGRVNQFTRRSFIAMFVWGRMSVRRVARHHGVQEAPVEAALRDALVEGMGPAPAARRSAA